MTYTQKYTPQNTKLAHLLLEIERINFDPSLSFLNYVGFFELELSRAKNDHQATAKSINNQNMDNTTVYAFDIEGT